VTDPEAGGPGPASPAQAQSEAPAPTEPAGGADEDSLDVRPRRASLVAVLLAVLLFGGFAVVAALLRRTDTGVYFRTADQVSMVVLGALLAGAALLFARPRLRADAGGVSVRNVVTSHRLPWALVRRVSFPEGASWARLELPDDEYVAVLAIQAADGERAVAAIRRLRELHRRYAPVVGQNPQGPNQ
jgi:hypothetical protein